MILFPKTLLKAINLNPGQRTEMVSVSDYHHCLVKLPFDWIEATD